MDSGQAASSITDGHTESSGDAQPGSAFNTQWQPNDSTALQPAHLSLSHIPRAWERKPLSPFSRQKMRVGKVWKRATTAPVEIRRRKGSPVAGQMKPVKKMRLDGDGAVGVARWEGEREAGSPVRKIVLRRDRVDEGELAELPEGEEGGEVGDAHELEGGALVEVFDEEGKIMDADPSTLEEQQEWEDEVDDGSEEDEFNPTMMHLGEILGQAREQADAGAYEHGTEGHTNQSPYVNDATATKDHERTALLLVEEQTPASHVPTRDELVLPEGFVSPVKQAPVPTRRAARKSIGSRRRTLPIEWKPSRLRQSMLAEDIEDDAIVEMPEQALCEQTDSVVEQSPLADHEVAQDAEQEWEDVVEEADVELQSAADGALQDEACLTTIETANDDFGAPSCATEPNQDISPSKLPSSPVPTVEGQHPRLPLRRSPRRRSASPIKQRATRPLADKPHLVAFTPVKGLDRFSAFTLSSTQPTEPSAASVSTPLLERSVSAPPEEPANSPQRPSRPRISDDTALLQAFLNRAAETKSSGRRLSATQQESITNRRDSDAVRQALASPVKPEVLAEMDPNSPSPRKSTIASNEIDNANILPDAQSPQQKTRRSGRARQRAAPQTATPTAAPNKISIRGNSDNVVLRKSEAQELSHLTRTNTRKNKGGSILPLYRLDKLRQQGIADPLDDGTAGEGVDAAGKPNSKGKALRWNETLVEVWQGGDISEASILSEEPISAFSGAPVEEDRMDVDEDVPTSRAAPPPAAETPSKPRVRKLKTPRTAATSGKTLAAPVEAAASVTEKAEADAPKVKAPAPSKRRSRIATPAKGLTNASLLPADLELAPAPAPAPSKKAIPTPSTTACRSRKPPASKLPSLSSSTSAAPTSALGQGKENLISSPPKKKPSTSSKSVTAPPKLDLGASLGKQASEHTATLPGLASPAKKAGRNGAVIFTAGGSGKDTGAREEGGDAPAGLRSPAKKRTRRTVR